MTTIQWTDETWNPVRGCTRVSPGCMNCYAERQAFRFAGPGQGYNGLVKISNGHPQWTGEIVQVLDKLRIPYKWRRPRMVFVNSMSDCFHENVEDWFLDNMFAVMALCPQHIFQILTKRPDRMREYINTTKTRLSITARTGKIPPWPLPNVWLGVSVENQKYADERIPILAQTAAQVRFLSCEPLLEKIDITRWIDRDKIRLAGGSWTSELIDWVICGGESGPEARPFSLIWADSLRAQCVDHRVPFFMKQVGSNAIMCPTKDRKGGDMSEWPESLRVRQWPHTAKG